MRKIIFGLVGVVLVYTVTSFFKGNAEANNLVIPKTNSLADTSTMSLDQKVLGKKVKVWVENNTSTTASFGTSTFQTQTEPATTSQNKVETSIQKIIVAKDPSGVEEKPSLRVIKGTITDEDGLLPTDYTLKVGVPVKLEIDVKADIDPYGCMSTIMIQGLYNQPIALKGGEKIVMEFTPKKTGEYYITCVMGNGWGVINVVK